MGDYSNADYKKKLDAVFARFPSVQKVPFNEAYKPGLEHMTRFETLLDDPHQAYRTIHVAGTNGKGSVANMLASALSASGLKVGLYTSPHIADFRERMRVAGPFEAPVHLVPKEYVYDFLCRHGQDMDALDLSFFEITTGMAFRWFADEKVDVAVIEVGLGGRLDSTNIITPDLSIVTSIALDHCALLGNTLADIAWEKAGIFKKHVPALVGEYLPETRPVFEEKARETGGELVFAQDAEPSAWHRKDEFLRRMDLRGKYQEKNLRTVLAAIDILRKMPPYEGLGDSEAVFQSIVRTASAMGFHGRWERISIRPFIIADIGHNPAALKENFAQLEEMRAAGDFSSLIVVYAVMSDKDLDGIMPLMPEDATYIFTSPGNSRALPESELAARYRAFCDANGRRKNRIHDAPDVRQALSMAIALAKDAPSLIFVGGSTYLVSEVVQVLKPLQGF